MDKLRMGLQMINCVDEFFFHKIAFIFTQFWPNLNPITGLVV